MTRHDLAFALLTFTTLAACGSRNDAKTPDPSGQGGYAASANAPSTGVGGNAATGTGATGTGATGTGATGTGAAPTTGGTGGASGMPDPTQIAAQLGPLLTPLGQTHAPGAKPEGSSVGGFLMQGQVAMQKVTLQPGKCYTGVAMGLPPVTDVLLELVPDSPVQLPVVPPALSESKGNTLPAVMAGGANCFRNATPLPIPAIFRVTARAGSGAVLAQLYAK